MRLSIRHRTVYEYGAEVCASIQYLRLTPRNDETQQLHGWRLRAPGCLAAWQDAYGNALHTLTCEGRRRSLVIDAEGEVETFDGVSHATGRRDILRPAVFLRATPATRCSPAMQRFARQFRAGEADSVLDNLLEMMHAIRATVDFRTGSSHVHTTAEEAFNERAGVCQDHAHIFIACCRELGIPARYVGGYLLLFENSDRQEAGHAWAEAWIDEEIGWVSFDVANTRHSHATHVRVAVGMDFRDATPVSGVRTGGGNESMRVEVQVVQMQQ
jgi:transglutaminase-like putative cysteine protease